MAPVDAGADVNDGAVDDGSDGTIDCIGAKRPALFCDDFEGKTLRAEWTTTLQPVTHAKVDLTTARFLSGQQGLNASMSPLPANGVASTRWKRTPAVGPLAVQWSFFWQSDAYNTSWTFPVGALMSGGDRVATIRVAVSSSNGAGTIQLVNGGTAKAVVPVKLDQWNCVELVFDGAKVTAFSGAGQADIPVSATVDGAELMFEWAYGANASASAGVAFDDFIASPARLPCIH